MRRGGVPSWRQESGFAVSVVLYVLAMAGAVSFAMFGSSQVLRTTVEIQRDQDTKKAIRAAADTLSAASSLINSNLNISPPDVLDFGSIPGADTAKLPTNAATGSSSGSVTSYGVMTASSGTRQLDGWQRFILFCRWEGLTANPADPAILLISAGADAVRDTACGDSTAQGDDLIERLSVGQTIERANVWRFQNSGSPEVQFGIAANAVKATDAGDLTANSLTLASPLALGQGGTGATSASSARTALGSGATGDSLFQATTAAGARTTLGAGATGEALFQATTAAGARGTLGSGATGDDLFQATTAAGARTALGSGATGDSLFQATTAAGARTTLGAGATGEALFQATTAAGARTTLGAGATGDDLFQSTTAAGARATLGAGATGEAVFQSANSTAALTALGLIGGSVTIDAGITGTANTSTYLADGGNILAGAVPIARGGTGATSASDARTALGAGATGGSVFTATNQTAALTALGLVGGSVTLDASITGNAATATSATTATTLSDGANITTGTVGVARGGTGAADAATARSNLGTDNAANITTGTLAAAYGGAAFPGYKSGYWYGSHPGAGSGTGVNVNRQYLTPVVVYPPGCTANAVGVYVTVGGGTPAAVKGAIYANNITTARAGLLVVKGSTPTTTETSNQDITIVMDTPTYLAPGIYWLSTKFTYTGTQTFAWRPNTVAGLTYVMGGSAPSIILGASNSMLAGATYTDAYSNDFPADMSGLTLSDQPMTGLISMAFRCQ